MSLVVFFVIVVSIVALIGITAVIFGNGSLIVLAVVSLPMSIIILLCVTEVETSVKEGVVVENTTTCSLAPLDSKIDEFSDAIGKYVVRGENQTLFLPFSEDDAWEVDVDNDYVCFEYVDGAPSVLIRECCITRRHYYSFVFYVDDIAQYTSYKLQVPEDTVLCKLNDGEYAKLAETSLEPR